MLGYISVCMGNTDLLMKLLQWNTVMLLCFACEKPLRFLRSYLCEWAVLILAPPSIFTSKCVVTIIAAYWPISALSVSEKLVYHFRFLALCCLACFSNTRFTVPFASRVASTPIPVSLRLGNGIVWLKYWWLPVLILKKTKKQKKKNKKNKKKKQKKNRPSFCNCHLHCCYTTQTSITAASPGTAS